MQNGVKPHQLGTATGAVNFFRLLGGAIVVAVFGAIVLGSAGGGAMTLEKLRLPTPILLRPFAWCSLPARCLPWLRSAA